MTTALAITRDECLRGVSTEMKAALKCPSGLVARHGGEEFGLLLLDTDADGALQLANHVRHDCSMRRSNAPIRASVPG